MAYDSIDRYQVYFISSASDDAHILKGDLVYWLVSFQKALSISIEKAQLRR